MVGERGFAMREHMCVHAPEPGAARSPRGYRCPWGAALSHAVCATGRVQTRERGSRETLTCPRTLMDTMFGSASLLSAFTLSSALLIVSLAMWCGAVAGGALGRGADVAEDDALVVAGSWRRDSQELVQAKRKGQVMLY